jgi:hypothetical protein
VSIERKLRLLRLFSSFLAVETVESNMAKKCTPLCHHVPSIVPFRNGGSQHLAECRRTVGRLLTSCDRRRSRKCRFRFGEWLDFDKIHGLKDSKSPPSRVLAFRSPWRLCAGCCYGDSEWCDGFLQNSAGMLSECESCAVWRNRHPCVLNTRDSRYPMARARASLQAPGPPYDAAY